MAGMPSKVRMPNKLDEMMAILWYRHAKVAVAGLPGLAGMPSKVRRPSKLDMMAVLYGRHTKEAKVAVACQVSKIRMPSKVDEVMK